TLASVGEGMTVLDLGGGTGYGAAILAALVGDHGRVITVEIDPRLSARATALCPPQVRVVCGDACDPASWGGSAETIDAIVVGFALPTLPPWIESLRSGTVVVAPVAEPGDPDVQRLTRVVIGGATETFEAVRYVLMRREAPPAPPSSVTHRKPRSLPVV